jgi:PKD repeat protein
VKLNFSQGIIRHQTDVNGNPTFLQRSGQFVNLIVSPNPTVLAIMHRGTTYIVEELKTVLNAWGPILTPQYLYWDVNLLTGVLTRGMTAFPPVYASSEPTSPELNQHWFDTDQKTFFVWTNQGWTEKVRVFAGYATPGATPLKPQRAGFSQAGQIGNFDGGNIVLDSFGMPLRESNGCFVTTVTQLNVVNLGTVTTQLEGFVQAIQAIEEIPKFHLVSLKNGRRAVLARSDDHNTRIAGIVVEDLYEGNVGKLFCSGLIRSPEFNWPVDQINRPLFCNTTGKITLTAPTQGVLQQIGFVYDVDAVFISIHQVVVLDSPDSLVEPPVPPTNPPIAGFVASTLSGIAPLDVTFTSTAADALMIEWDFKNDGFIDATGPHVFKTYDSPGVYTVRQKVTNGFGSDEEIKINYITVTAPVVGPTSTNLGLSFRAPNHIIAGNTFSFQTVVSNDGLLNATNIQRSLVLKSDNNSQLTIVSPPVGCTVTYSGNKTRVSMPLISLASGASAMVTLQVQVQSNVKSVTIDGVAISPEHDVEMRDNSGTLTIEART